MQLKGVQEILEAMSGEGMTSNRFSGGAVGWELKEASVVPKTVTKAFVPGLLLSNKFN